MGTLGEALVDYLGDVVGLDAEITPSKKNSSLPQYLRQRYVFFDLTVEGRRFLFIQPVEAENVQPGAIEKQIRSLSLEDAEGICLLVASLPRYTRKRLIEKKIPFIIPGVQLYWPAMGLLVHPRGRRQEPETVEQLRPASQAVVLLMLTGRMAGDATPKQLAAELGYSAMTMTRALNEITATGLGVEVKSARRRLLQFEQDPWRLWELARPVMRSPVRKAIALPQDALPESLRLLAGESALAERSMLTPPVIPVFAIGQEVWRKLRGEGIEPVELEEPGTCRVQIWDYDPQLFSDGRCVDVFSLYLSLQQDSDDRVQSALDEMMEHFRQWL